MSVQMNDNAGPDQKNEKLEGRESPVRDPHICQANSRRSSNQVRRHGMSYLSRRATSALFSLITPCVERRYAARGHRSRYVAAD